MISISLSQSQLGFPDDVDDVSDAAKELICKLITTPQKRLGQNGVSDFKMHPFFEGLDWDELKTGNTIFLLKKILFIS